MKRRIPPLVTDTAGYHSCCRPGKRKGLLPKAITLAVALCLAAEVAIANPNGFAVVNGQVVLEEYALELDSALSPSDRRFRDGP